FFEMTSARVRAIRALRCSELGFDEKLAAWLQASLPAARGRRRAPAVTPRPSPRTATWESLAAWAASARNRAGTVDPDKYSRRLAGVFAEIELWSGTPSRASLANHASWAGDYEVAALWAPTTDVEIEAEALLAQGRYQDAVNLASSSLAALPSRRAALSATLL